MRLDLTEQYFYILKRAIPVGDIVGGHAKILSLLRVVGGTYPPE